MLTDSQPQVGLQFRQVQVRAWNRTGVTLNPGAVVAFNLSQSGSETTSYAIGESDSVFANLIVPAQGGAAGILHGIVVEGGDDNEKVLVCVQGICRAFTASTLSGTLGYGAQIFSQGSVAPAGGKGVVGVADAALGTKCIGYSLETGVSNGDSFYALIDGIFGFGVTRLG